jgi:hypothetical protein
VTTLLVSELLLVTCGGRVILRKDISIMMMGLVLSGLSLIPPAAVAAVAAAVPMEILM